MQAKPVSKRRSRGIATHPMTMPPRVQYVGGANANDQPLLNMSGCGRVRSESKQAPAGHDRTRPRRAAQQTQPGRQATRGHPQ